MTKLKIKKFPYLIPKPVAVIGAVVDEKLLEKNIPNIEKVKPFSYYYDRYYWKNGERLAEAYQIGKNIT